jgi:hypothetical protein
MPGIGDVYAVNVRMAKSGGTGIEMSVRLQVVDSTQASERAGRGRRLLDWALARRLDEALARGDRPDSSVLLAFHARVLQSAAMREKLARKLITIAVASHHTRTAKEERSSLNWGVIQFAYNELDDLALRLAAAELTAARGVAMARLLLTDRDGLLLSAQNPHALRAAAREALAALEPAPAP